MEEANDCLTLLVSGRTLVSWCFITDLFLLPGQNYSERSNGLLTLSGLVLYSEQQDIGM